ncbi:hypothetical protein [Xanthomonas arboricola]|uniref:hypothetical protein n=1 Tax=Xanthomonas arboricola TaxID=56448 RepID=UPI000E1ECF8B|nr:hypothetical protein [Xanthomonas arboricola]
MQKQKKRHGASRGALIKPNRKVHSKHDTDKSLKEVAEFPSSVWRDLAAASLQRAGRSQSVDELKYHLRQWVWRHAFYMRGLHSNWPEYSWSVFDSVCTASGLRVRFRRDDVRTVCRTAARIALGED